MFTRSCILLCALALLVAGCGVPLSPPGAIKGSGKYATRDYPVSGFKGIDACCGFRVTVTGGDAFKVTATADDNILDYVVVKHEGEMLRIAFDTAKISSFSTTRLEVAVTMPELQRATVNGGAHLLVASPAPKSTTLTLSGQGGSRAELTAMTTAKASVTLGGGASATLNVTESLDYDVSGGAQLRYSGHPNVGKSSVSGGASAVPF